MAGRPRNNNNDSINLDEDATNTDYIVETSTNRKNENIQKMDDNEMEELNKEKISDKEEKVLENVDLEDVTLMYKDVVSEKCRIEFGKNGKFGSVSGYGDLIDVPHKEFFREFLSERKVQLMISKRELVIVSGLSNKNLKKAKCLYGDGEYIPFEDVEELLVLSLEKLKKVFAKLSEGQKEVVGTLFATALNKKDSKVTREKLVEMNKISKDGLFNQLLKQMPIDAI